MIKTLRITSIVAAMLAVVLLILPAVFGVRGDAKIEEFLKSPGAVDNFIAARGRPGAPGARDESQTSPLVKQAADFARYLNPPPPPPPKAAPAAARPASQPAPPAPVTPKFDLIGTSFYAARPELSLALIDEPGKGLNWVRQGSAVGHLTIEQVKDGSIIVRDGQGSSEMTVTVNQPWRSLLKSPPPETEPAVSPVESPAAPSTGTGRLPSVPVAPPLAGQGRPGFGVKNPTPATASQKIVGQPASEASAGSEQTAPDPVYEPSPQEKEKQAQIDKVFAEISEIGEGRITGDEAAKLDELTKLVEELEKIKAAEQLAEPQPESPDQTDANTPSDADE